MTVILLVVGMLAGIILFRLPVAVALLVPCVVYILFSDFSFAIAFQQITGGVDSFVLLAIPMFVLMGSLASAAGITDRMYDAARAMIGHVRGSHGYINIFVSLGFSWMNGSALADVAGVGKMEIPAMVKAGYDRRFALGITGASALIGPIMPPSIPAVIFAITAGVSMGGMFIAGIGPALLLTTVLVVTVWFMMRKQHHLKLVRATPMEMVKRVLIAAPSLMTPVILLGGILGGLFTPTEAAGIAVAYMFLLGLAYRSLTRKKIAEVIRSSAHSSASVMIIIAAATIFAWILTVEGAQTLITEIIVSTVHETWVFLLVLNVLLLVLGTVMETSSLILILVPVLLPIAVEFGVDPLHFGVIVVFNLMVGLLTPPLGLLLFMLKSVTGYPFRDVVTGVAKFAVPIVASLAVLTFIPQISLFLPRLLGF